MKKKNIELTNDQYKTLVKLIFYGEWLLNANKAGAKEMDKTAEELCDYIYSKKATFNLQDWFKELAYGEELKEAKIKSFLKKIFDYNEETFWFYLTDKLASRDALIEYLKQGKTTPTFEEIEILKYDYTEKYETTFAENDINLLFLIDDTILD